ncbi:MAG: prepilin-type N-terminal cleavage/methylation domain-containing protein [Candidatus Eremiobacteraeota bacterium]|nr:prepilin-type N-terminal cleavage/methylation domain-containing protein [Candidatus Eremiobacteraeota bacterium]
MSRNCTARGLSLLEVLVAMGLAALVATYFLGILIPSIRHTARATARANLAQEAMLVFDHLEKDIRGASAPTIFDFQEADGTRWIAIQRLMGVGASRTQTWNTQEAPFAGVVYRFGGSSLRLVRFGDVNLRLVGLGDPTLIGIRAAVRRAPEVELAPHLSDFRWQEDAATGLVTVGLTLTSQDPDLGLTMERVLAPRNSLRTSSE